MKKIMPFIGGLLLCLIGCSDDKSEPTAPVNPDSDKPTIENPTEGEDVKYLSAQEFEEMVCGTYWKFDTSADGYGFFYADGTPGTNEGLDGFHALAAFQIDESKTMREWWAVYEYRHQDVIYNPDNGFMSMNGHSPIRVDKIENGKLYLTYNFDNSLFIKTEDGIKPIIGSYTKSVYRPMTDKEIAGYNESLPW